MQAKILYRRPTYLALGVELGVKQPQDAPLSFRSLAPNGLAVDD